ncbi:MAG: metalloregulator ArsR/SmtB family transcription factor [Pseudomonadota bacterium]
MKNTLDVEEAAQMFAAIGSEPRLDLLRTLVRAGEAGLTVGQLQERLSIPGSTLSHHLRFLSAAGLIEQEKQGRVVMNRAAFDTIHVLASYLVEECCADEIKLRAAS